MHPHIHAAAHPDKPAIIVEPSGEVVTYRQLDERSNQGAHLFRKYGLRPGDHIAFVLENDARFFEALWAAQRSGLIYTCISTKLAQAEVEYILSDSDAKLVIISRSLAAMASQIKTAFPNLPILLAGGSAEGLATFEVERDRQPATRIADESAGVSMLYSSGTTGRPKGVRATQPATTAFDEPSPALLGLQRQYGMAAESIYLSPAPLYHAAPLAYCTATLRLGGSVVVMQRFDAELALQLIERRHVTHAQWVPTHFIKMLKLPAAMRERYDLRSLQVAIHAAAPCPVPVKEAMLAWWGPIIHEYYSGTEGIGGTYISPQEWLQHKGSVGRPQNSKVWICDEEGNPVPAGEDGVVYFEGGASFTYHNDPAKTAGITTSRGWRTFGDVGRVDDEGYLYLTDRKSFMIISGGVNIYPQEIENLLVTHPRVADVAVVGAPHEEMGEQVVAVVQPMNWADAGDDLAAELIEFARAHLSHVKTPRRVDFMKDLPRHDTGKLYKRLLRDAYWKDPVQPIGATP